MKEKTEYFCARCGAPGVGNVTSGAEVVCGKCVLGAVAYVSGHPDEFPELSPLAKPKIKLRLRRIPRERGGFKSTAERWNKTEGKNHDRNVF